MRRLLTVNDVKDLLTEMPFSVMDDDRGRAADDIWSSCTAVEAVRPRTFRHPFADDDIIAAWAVVRDLLTHLSNTYGLALEPEQSEPKLSHEQKWAKNIIWLGEQFEKFRARKLWCLAFSMPSISSLNKPDETMMLFARAVFLRNVAGDMLDESPERTAELDQLNAMLRAIHGWLDESEGQNWCWSGHTNNLACYGLWA